MTVQEKKVRNQNQTQAQSGFSLSAVLKGSVIGLVCMLICTFICSVMIIKDVISLNSIFPAAIVIAAVSFLIASFIASAKSHSGRLVAGIASNLIIFAVLAVFGLFVANTSFSLSAAIYMGVVMLIASIVGCVLSSVLVKR